MKPYGKIVIFGFLVMVAIVLASHSSRVLAVQPHPYGLFDAKGTYLGDIIGAYTTNLVGVGVPNNVSYVTYLPSVEGILQFSSGTGGAIDIKFANVPGSVEYDALDCQGNAYINTAAGETAFTSPWIVEVQNQTYKVATSSTSVEILSTNNGYGTFCQNSTSVMTEYKLTLIQLPFDVNSVTPPFKIK